jgi:hypothetical protein
MFYIIISIKEPGVPLKRIRYNAFFFVINVPAILFNHKNLENLKNLLKILKIFKKT